MELYKITYNRLLEEDGIFLCDHENSIIKYLETDDYKDHKILLINGCDLNDYLDATEFGKTYLEVTDSTAKFIREHKDDFENYASCNMYTDYTLEPSTDEEWDRCIDAGEMDNTTFENLSIITEDQFEEAMLKMFKEEYEFEDSLTDEQKEQAELILDQIDHFMAKGRESVRAQERGEAYLRS